MSNTAERIQREIAQYYGHGPTAPKTSPLSQTIAAEIDRLTAERDAARAEIKRMTFGYGAWEAWRRWLDSQTEAAASQFILAEERAIGAAKG